MKITRDTPDQLIVESRPWLLAIMLVAFVLAFVGLGLWMLADGELLGGLMFAGVGGGVGLVALWAFVRRVQVILHRPGNWCERREKSLTGTRVVRHRLDEIARAEVEATRTDKGVTERVVLVIEAGESRGRHPIVAAYDNIHRHHEIAGRINAWLAEGREAERPREDG